MSDKVKCPKCGSFGSWIVRDAGGMMQRCVCGLARPVIQQAEGNITILRSAVKSADAVLPQIGTKTRRCLMATYAAWPRDINTGDIAQAASLENKETSSLLMTLMARGLVERVSERRGLLGGSEWKVTLATLELLKL